MVNDLKKILKVQPTQSIWAASFLIVAANLIIGLLGYVFQILAGRFLGPSDFSGLVAILSLYVILGSPLSALGTFLTHKVSILRIHGDKLAILKLYKTINLRVLKVVLFVVIIYIATDFKYFHNPIFSSGSSLFFFMLLVALEALVFTNNAFLQALRLFQYQAGINTLWAVLKTILGIGLIYFGYGLNGALLGLVLAMFISWAIGKYALSREVNIVDANHQNKTHNDPVFGIGKSVLIGSISFAILTQSDVFLIKLFATNNQVDMYAAISVLGKAILYIPAGIVVALFPIAIEKNFNNSDSKDLFIHALIVSLIASFAIALIYWYSGSQIIGVLYGDQYQNAESMLWKYGIAMVPLSLVVVIQYYAFALKINYFIYLLLFAAICQSLLIIIFSQNIQMIILIIFIVSSVLCLSGIFISLLINHQGRRVGEG